MQHVFNSVEEKNIYLALVELKKKVRRGVDGGPFGDSVIITASECTLIYRYMFEPK